MKVSTKTRYALRMMLQLALDYGKGLSMLGEIARREDLSEKYLSLIVIPLRANELVNSTRGSKGGYYLARHPSKITVKDIYEAMEGRICSVECTASKKKCRRASDCVNREVWKNLDGAIAKTLEATTLQCLVEMHKKKNVSTLNYEI